MTMRQVNWNQQQHNLNCNKESISQHNYILLQ